MALALCAVLGSAYLANRPKASVPAPTPTAAARPVLELASSDLATVGTAQLSLTLPVSGSLMPAQQATIRAKVGGQLQGGLLAEGMPVARGQVIARVDGAELHARLAMQQATLEEAQAKLALAQKNNHNNQQLLKQNYISHNAVDTSKNSVDLAQASVKSAQANSEIARITLTDSVIKAPIGGIISRRHAQPGEKVAPDMQIYTIVNLDQLNLEAQVPASEIARIKLDQAVSFQVDGYGERTFSGKVSRINPTTEAGSRTIVVYITVDNRDGALKGGMFAKGSITTSHSAPAPVIPLAALRQHQGQTVVYAIENNKVVARQVTTGLKNPDEGMVEIAAGIPAGTQILVTPLQDVKPGNQVKLPATQASSTTPANGSHKG
jgi:RND family efflux transporter MFP subunit